MSQTPPASARLLRLLMNDVHCKARLAGTIKSRHVRESIFRIQQTLTQPI